MGTIGIKSLSVETPQEFRGVGAHVLRRLLNGHSALGSLSVVGS